MTPIAKLIEMRDAARGNESAWRGYELDLSDACDQVELGGGGLLERHAMLEEAVAALLEFADLEEDEGGYGWPWDEDAGRLRAAIAKLRASDALPTTDPQRCARCGEIHMGTYLWCEPGNGETP